MKYVLYKFPNILRYTDSGEPYLLTSNQDEAIRGEVIAVEYGDDIDDVREALMQDIRDDLSETYNCPASAYEPDEVMENLEYFTSEHFDFEMTGISHDLSLPKNRVITFGVKVLPEGPGDRRM